jgi:hypothetical protein
MPRSVFLVGLAQRSVIPQKQFYNNLFFYDPVVLEASRWFPYVEETGGKNFSSN